MANGMAYVHRIVAYEKYGQEAFTKHVHHIDGDKRNNIPGNITLVEAGEHTRVHAPWMLACPGSRSTPRMMVGETCGDEVRKLTRKRYCSFACVPIGYKIEWPQDAALVSLVAEVGYSATGRLLGVSDNAIRKRLRKRTKPL